MQPCAMQAHAMMRNKLLHESRDACMAERKHNARVIEQPGKPLEK
jgi:hypothetical protein